MNRPIITTCKYHNAILVLWKWKISFDGSSSNISIFRCDDQIKQSLSEFANTVYDDIWVSRGRPSNIHIMDQNLKCEGDLLSKRYGSPHGRSFDGIHMRGELAVQHYTRSMIDVFTSVFPHILGTQNTQVNTATRQAGNF